MGTFASVDGTRLAYHGTGDLVCLPGGPMRASEYFGDLGGLAPFVRLDLRGTGESSAPADEATFRCDQQVDDVEALRRELGREQLDLAGHSGGGTLAILYAVRHPERIRRLVLIAPSPYAVGLEVADEDRRELVELRRGEPWFAEAYAGFERIWAGQPSEGDWDAITPFTYGRWDAASQADHAARATQQNAVAADQYYRGYDPAPTRTGLAGLDLPVLLIAGEFDVALPPKRAAEYVALFPRAELVVQAGAGHSPWLDDPTAFSAAVRHFLS
jgi:pimeloyl-ACP methyl ester carboxylesterase